MSWPVIWVLTVTVASGVTVPSALMTIGMSPLAAAAMPTGVACALARSGRRRPAAPAALVLMGRDVPAGARDNGKPHPNP